MSVSEESYRRAREKYLKMLSLEGAGSPSVSPAPTTSAPLSSGHISSERTISTEAPLESMESEDNIGNLRKRKRGPEPCKGKSTAIAEPPVEITDLTSEDIPLRRFPVAGRQLVEAPPSLSMESLDSLFYDRVDLVPLVSNRLLLPKDHEENMAVANLVGASQYGLMVVGDLARGISQVLSLIPFLASQEKALAKFEGINPETASELQSKLDSCMGELCAVKANLRESEEERERCRKTLEEMQQELESVKRENEGLSNTLVQREGELCEVKGKLADREKGLQEVQSALASAQTALDKADLENFGMFLRGFGEAKAQIQFFNPNTTIDMTQVSEYREIGNVPPPSE